MSAPGGYRAPANPAPVSGPAQLSARTDGGPADQKQWDLPDAKYGEEKAYRAQQAGAPLAKAAEMGPGPAMPDMTPDGGPPGEASPAGMPPERPPLTGLGAPSSRPGEPVTAGAPWGAGPGAPNQGVDVGPGQLSAALQPFFAEDETGYLRLLAHDLAEWGI